MDSSLVVVILISPPPGKAVLRLQLMEALRQSRDVLTEGRKQPTGELVEAAS